MPQISDRHHLHQAIAKLFPDQRVISLTPIIERGLSNTKFLVALDNNDSVLVRVNEQLTPELGLKRFQKAKLCSAICETVGLPVAAVLRVGELENGKPYSVETWISKGVPADTFTKEADRISIWKNVAIEAAKLKDVDLQAKQDSHNFGFDGDSPTQTWEQHLKEILSAIEDETILELSVQQKTTLAELLIGFPLAKYPAGLCHGDLKLDNVLVDPDSFKVIAVLDWELARYVPSIVGELATSLEPAVLDLKKYAVPRTLKERNAVLAGFAKDVELQELERDFTIFFAADIVMNLNWYNRNISQGLRPDIPVLKERLSNYLQGLQLDIANLRKILA